MLSATVDTKLRSELPELMPPPAKISAALQATAHAVDAAASRHLIIGTAGHVDHGKTSLIRALTGTETDRLREEQERGMSIDLGFAEFRLPGGRRAGVIDVPGHERFLKNMLAGAGGMDLVLLVIAADEGVMPQTREHFEILSLLQIRRGVIVLTKADLVDEEWLDLVREEVREFVRGTFLAEAPLAAVDSHSGRGIAELTALLDSLADTVPTRPISGPWRLPIDRIFTAPGFGSVVTGTLLSGVVRVGDRVEVLPAALESRIRSLQVHGENVSFAEAGTRVALNLAGLETAQLERGEVAAPPQAFPATQAFDARLEVLASCPREIKHRTRVRAYLGSAEVLGRLYLLDAETLKPGQSGLVQLRLESPTVAARGDRFVLRFYSPMETLGGGQVLEPLAARHRRQDEAVLANLRLIESGTPEENVAEAVARGGLKPVAPAAVAAQLSLPVAEVQPLLDALTAGGRLIVMENGHYLHRHRLDAAAHHLLAAIAEYHAAQPMRAGMSREELRSRLSRLMDAKGFQLLLSRLEAEGAVVVEGSRLRLPDHAPQFTPAQRTVADALERGLLADPFNAPFYPDLCAAAGLQPRAAQEVWDALISNGVVVRLDTELFLHRDAIGEATCRVREYLTANQEMTAGQLRDLLGTSRKYAVPLMEHLDSRKVTHRVGDVRVLY